jgi:hypothetical protein
MVSLDHSRPIGGFRVNWNRFGVMELLRVTPVSHDHLEPFWLLGVTQCYAGASGSLKQTNYCVDSTKVSNFQYKVWWFFFFKIIAWFYESRPNICERWFPLHLGLYRWILGCRMFCRIHLTTSLSAYQPFAQFTQFVRPPADYVVRSNYANS